MKNLFIMVGVPGSGKTTFLDNIKKKVKDKNIEIVSRDSIRFSLVKPEEDYFSREAEVQTKFWKEINQHLAEGKHVFVDQTSISIASRKKLLKNIHGYDFCFALIMDTDLQICIERNKKRTGRACVPEKIIYQMWNNYEKPRHDEGFDGVLNCNSNGEIYVPFYVSIEQCLDPVIELQSNVT